MTYRGTVTEWNDEDGHGVVEVPDVGPVWTHYSAIQAEPGAFRSLPIGQQVVLEIDARPSDAHSDAPGFRWVALDVQAIS